MAHFVKITNMLNQALKTNYRMPRSAGEAKLNPVLAVDIQPRAMLNTLIFPDRNYYDEWRKQNNSLFLKGVLVEGEAINEKKILAENERITKENSKNSDDKIEKNIEKIEESADNINIGLQFELATEEENKKRGRKRKQ